MGEWQPIETAIEAAKSNDGWIRRCLFGIKRPWGWEAWVGQCDGGLWLGRQGDGSCWECDKPTHWMLLPPPPRSETQRRTRHTLIAVQWLRKVRHEAVIADRKSRGEPAPDRNTVIEECEKIISNFISDFDNYADGKLKDALAAIRALKSPANRNAESEVMP